MKDTLRNIEPDSSICYLHIAYIIMHLHMKYSL